jgi:hypothetical protein
MIFFVPFAKKTGILSRFPSFRKLLNKKKTKRRFGKYRLSYAIKLFPATRCDDFASTGINIRVILQYKIDFGFTFRNPIAERRQIEALRMVKCNFRLMHP